jgi:hypothetical protein
MLDHQVIRRQRAAREYIVDVAQLDHVDDVRLDGGREVLFPPLSHQLLRYVRESPDLLMRSACSRDQALLPQAPAAHGRSGTGDW